MTAIIVALTLRQLLARGRTVLMGLLALLPILLAVAYRIGGEDGDRADWVAGVLLEGLVVTTLLPLAALVYGTAALGAEIEDGTAVYLLAKPVRRSRIIAGKLAAAWALTAVTVIASGIGAAAIGLGGAPGGGSLMLGFGVALAVGSLVYTALFMMLSVVTSRALIAGLAYVFVWEGLINGLFAGTRLLSVRHYTLGIADVIADVPPDVFRAKLGSGTAIVLMAVACVASVWVAIRRLERIEIGETT